MLQIPSANEYHMHNPYIKNNAYLHFSLENKSLHISFKEKNEKRT